MLIESLGGVGIGLVWGFAAASVAGPLRHPLRSGLALALATLLIAGEIFFFGAWPALLTFFGSATVAFTVRFAWRRELRSRYAAPPS
jgi:hypothetical protein